MSNYADDNQIYFSDRNPQVVKSVINGDITVVSRWFDDNKLVLNPVLNFFQKAILVIFPLVLVMYSTGSYRRPFGTIRRNYR